MNRAVFIFLFVSDIWFIVNGQELSRPDSLDAKKINKDIFVDGILEKKEWASTDSIEGFSAPWSPVGNDHTVFKCFYSDRYFCFCFIVTDNTITTYDFKEELTVAKEDRVELFFSALSDLSQYYCIEIDPLGHVLDYSASYYRKFNYSWDFDQIDVSAQKSTQGYMVEGRISLSELEKLGIRGSFFLGIFRADYRSHNADNVVWYSWIEPKSQTPDFHIPTALGICNFMKQ